MFRPKDKRRNFVTSLSLILIIHVTNINAGATPNPKNLVNLYTHPSNDDTLNQTGSNQHQNGFQFRQLGGPKIIDRHKPNTPNNDPVFEHYTSEINFPGNTDYIYQDSRSANIPDCKGRVRLNGTRGYISDGSGFYQINLQCIWLIDSGSNKNATIRIQLHKFNTECNYDYLYIFDGDSIYSPLVAALSGDINDFSTALVTDGLRNKISNNNISLAAPLLDLNHTNSQNSYISSQTEPLEIITNSGKAFIYFHSDTAQSMPGFYLSYTIDSCPFDCSGRGECDLSSLKCNCNPSYYGDGCQFIGCPNNCTSPLHGTCDNQKSCICNQGFQGIDCSLNIGEQIWNNLGNQENLTLGRAFHQTAVIGDTMWIVGGRTKLSSNTNMGIYRTKKTVMVSSFDLGQSKWSDITIQGNTGDDHLAELSGHSIAVKGSKIYIYGGMAMNNTVLDALTVLDTISKNISSLPGGRGNRNPDDKFVVPIGAVGHTANIVNNSMYVFLGFNPIYGYLNFVQKFDMIKENWTLVERKGSSVSGCIGHTTVYDPVNERIYLYGGHNAHRLNSLYSFDLNTEVWTLLQPGPSPRYYHSAVIIQRHLVIIGGNSYNTSYQNDQCFRHNYMVYDLNCKRLEPDTDTTYLETNGNDNCYHNCWSTIDSFQPNVLKRHGHTVVKHNHNIILFGGFNGLIMGDLHSLSISKCDSITEESICTKPKLGLSCYWNVFDSKCEDKSEVLTNSASQIKRIDHTNCTKSNTKFLQSACETRETCSDCLSTDIGCVWCSLLSQCHHNKCKSYTISGTTDPEQCYKDAFVKNPLIGMSLSGRRIKEFPDTQDIDNEMECKRIENCFLCHSKPYCSWQNDACSYTSSGLIPSHTNLPSPFTHDDLNDLYMGRAVSHHGFQGANSSRSIQRYDPLNRSFLAAITSSFLNPTPYHSCDVPCYLRHSCNECISNKCIWCSTSEQCLDSSAYFVYHPMGQCMHYVAHTLKCPVASCSGIESCDKCLANPKCGWLNDIANTGKGKCIEGTSGGPSLDGLSNEPTNITSLTAEQSNLPNWFYTSCPPCQCNGHSYCRSNSSTCIQPCQDNTEGSQCDRCMPGYYGDPINGGACRPCRCNGHAHTCHRETGKCYCSTKGIIGHNCNRCDEQNHYVGDPLAPGNGTCYYNLTTDYQYTFNMSKSEDHFYSDINFINVPLRKDTDIDFTIACSRLALVNITSGNSLKNRKAIYSDKECGSIRLRVSPDKHDMSDANFSFYVHVHKFQTPFILQIAFSQHRTIYLPQVFFTFSSCFLFFFVLSGVLWKLKIEYDSYVRRQRQFIEMEQMASRPFSTIFLELSKTSGEKITPPLTDPTPISFEPCFSNNVGVLSVFVQLPGKPNLAIGSALVSLNEDENIQSERHHREKQHELPQNV